MTLLRRVLIVQAIVWTGWSLAIGIAPRYFFETLLTQAPLRDYAMMRASAVMGIVLASLMVLVARRDEDPRAWSWPFLALELGTASLFALNALFSLPTGSDALFWWLGAVVHTALGGLLLLGMAAERRGRHVKKADLHPRPAAS